jgi:hypothetical protein
MEGRRPRTDFREQRSEVRGQIFLGTEGGLFTTKL